MRITHLKDDHPFGKIHDPIGSTSDSKRHQLATLQVTTRGGLSLLPITGCCLLPADPTHGCCHHHHTKDQVGYRVREGAPEQPCQACVSHGETKGGPQSKQKYQKLGELGVQLHHPSREVHHLRPGQSSWQLLTPFPAEQLQVFTP